MAAPEIAVASDKASSPCRSDMDGNTHCLRAT